MKTIPYTSLATTLLLLLTVRAAASAGEPCCAHCGKHACCEKVCRLVVEEKKVEIVCWGCKCEDFCLPCPSCRGCKHCEEVCDFCDEAGDPDAPCTKSKKFVWYDWIPGCGAEVHTKKKLMKKIVVKKVPSYKWVVEDLCPACDQKCIGAQIEPGVEVPAPPVKGAKLKYVSASSSGD